MPVVKILTRLAEAFGRREPGVARLIPPTAVVQRGRIFIGGPAPKAAHNALGSPDLEPWRQALVALDEAAKEWTGWRRLVDPLNGDLHGPALRTIFSVCLLAEPRHRERIARLLLDQHVRAIGLLVTRLDRDWGGPARLRRLATLNGDAHRGQNRNVRVLFNDGGCWVYKPRPVDAEAALFGRDSLAERINEVLAREGGHARLPGLHVQRGSGVDGHEYGYIRWIAHAPLGACRQKGVVVRGVRIDATTAKGVWRDAGVLAAFAYAIGLTDLHASNLIIGRGEDGHVRYHVIDAEVFGRPVRELDQTLLTGADIRLGLPDHRHCGFESTVHLCGRETDRWAFVRKRRGWILAPIPSSRAVPVMEPALALDAKGRAGYARHLGVFLKGLLVGWDVMVRHRTLIEPAVRAALRRVPVRELVRDTAVYERAILAGLTTNAPGPTFRRDEQRQLAVFDVPYFFWRDGRLKYYTQYPSRTATVRKHGRNAPDLAIFSKQRIREEQVVLLIQDAVYHVTAPGRRLHVKQDEVEIVQAPPHLQVSANVHGRHWRVSLNQRTGRASVAVDR